MAFQLEPFFEYFAGESQQREGVALLQQAINPKLLSDDAAWVKAYRGQLPQQQQGEALLANPLHVPYDSQHDNPSGEGWRECFSSSCAMVAKFWLPDLDMNDYLRRRPQFGDSTDPSAQIRCLESFGLSARFVQVGSVEKLKAQIDRGRPAPVGFLHHGKYNAPTGGGHYAVAIGYTDESIIMNDPNGHLDPIEGGYLDNSRAEGVHYLWDFWAPRWSVANDHDGWGLDIWLPGKPEGGSSSSTPTKTAQPGIELIKRFESCKLEAYYCASNQLTIGVGHTGPDVYEGQQITQAVANDLLRTDLERFEKAVCELITVPLTQNEFDACVSFAFNCGEGALSESTFRKRINAGEDKATCFREEFCKWVNGSNGPLPGLVARRDAEVELATTSP